MVVRSQVQYNQVYPAVSSGFLYVCSYHRYKQCPVITVFGLELDKEKASEASSLLVYMDSRIILYYYCNYI